VPRVGLVTFLFLFFLSRFLLFLQLSFLQLPPLFPASSVVFFLSFVR